MSIEFHVSFARAPRTLERCEALLALAEDRPSERNMLSTVTSLVCASALEHFIAATIANEGFNYCNMNRVAIHETPFSPLRNESFRIRLMRLPEVVSSGRYLLDSRNVFVRHLHDLIDLRNEFMHLSDEPVRLPNDDVTLVVDANSTIVDFRVGGKLGEDPWESVDLPTAKEFHYAARAYLENIQWLDTSDTFRSSNLFIEAHRA
jgi:hypothetical protein